MDIPDRTMQLIIPITLMIIGFCSVFYAMVSIAINPNMTNLQSPSAFYMFGGIGILVLGFSLLVITIKKDQHETMTELRKLSPVKS